MRPFRMTSESFVVGRHEPKLLFIGRYAHWTQELELDDVIDGDVFGRSVDEEDRLPRKLAVRTFDLVCYLFSMLTYLMDVISDSVVIYIHLRDGRTWAAAIVAIFTILPSLTINSICWQWIQEDAKHSLRIPMSQDRRAQILRSKFVRSMMCVLQCGPVALYHAAFWHGRKFISEEVPMERRYHFCRMVEYERDACLLRVFEALLESAPQLVVQGALVTHAVWKQSFSRSSFSTTAMAIQLGSLGFSLLSVSWALIVQQRSIRLSRPDKVNLHPHECLLQLLWRSVTVTARVISLVLFALCFHYWILIPISIHFLLSLFHVYLLQSVDAPSPTMRVAWMTLGAAVHLIAPFNLADGNTRWRYGVAYAIELVECNAMLIACVLSRQFTFSYKTHALVLVDALYVLGLSTMLLYYWRFHPNRRRQLRIRQEEEDNKDKVVEMVVSS